MERKRLIWADSLKGVLIILVVLGHAIQYTIGNECYENRLWNIIYSFHMPAFMAVSGYLAFRLNSSAGGGNLRKFVSRRFRQLLIPFFLWTLVWAFIKGSISINVFFNYLLYPGSGLWFLWVLFIINVIFVLGSELSAKMRINQIYVILSIGFVLVALMTLFDIRVFGFQFVAYYFVFYSLGFFLHKYEVQLIRKNIIFVTLLTIVWFILAWFWQMHSVPVFLSALSMPNSILQYLYRFITAAIAVYVIIAISPMLLNKDSLWNIPFKWLGQVSLGIYAIHLTFMGMIVNSIRILELSPVSTILVAFLIGLSFSSMFVWVLKRSNITAKFMLGKI